MIDYGLFEFAAVPHTGVAWFLRACQLAGLGPGFAERAHTPFPRTPGRKLRVSLARHPCSWLGAQWRDGSASNHVGPIGCLNRDRGLEVFIEDYLRTCPGSLSRVLPLPGAETVLRFEDLPWAFTELVLPLGISSGLLRTAFFHAGPHEDHRAVHGKLCRDVVSAERELCERYDYW